MSLRRLGVFLALSVSSSAGAAIAALISAGLFRSSAAVIGGGVIGGIGVVLVVQRLLLRCRLTPARRARAVRAGALAGLALATALAIATLPTFIGPLISFVLVGLGAVIADIDAADRERRVVGSPVS
jgi:hypothetical protein